MLSKISGFTFSKKKKTGERHSKRRVSSNVPGCDITVIYAGRLGYTLAFPVFACPSANGSGVEYGIRSIFKAFEKVFGNTVSLI